MVVKRLLKPFFHCQFRSAMVALLTVEILSILTMWSDDLLLLTHRELIEVVLIERLVIQVFRVSVHTLIHRILNICRSDSHDK